MKKNANLKDGLFTKKELKLYSLKDNEISTILEYQERLPVLQQDNDNWINSRELHRQLNVGKDYSNWIKQQIDDLELEEGNEFSPLKGKTSKTGGRPNIDYLVTVEAAKNIAITAGSKGGNTGVELKLLSKLARKYFIYIEKAFKHRIEWNKDRNGTIIKCKELKGSLIRYESELLETMPDWFKGNKFVAEFSLLNEVIIGMSASEYRRQKGLKSSVPIRNTFTEQQLEWVEELERYDSDLIEVQSIFDFAKRKEILCKKFELMVKKNVA
ncbi:antA/AntB antirepressor family protein [Fictibacillus phosphorivorans]|uniref:antA/AntB antirepressor family protein n=1 Tax=Fictibacillus phosphorivorans TaxID=1221500 RepID=UPI0035E63B72